MLPPNRPTSSVPSGAPGVPDSSTASTKLHQAATWRILALGLAAVFAMFAVACGDSESDDPADLAITIQRQAGAIHEIDLRTLAPEGELEELATSDTPEGRIASQETYADLRETFPLVESSFRPLDDWLPYGIRGENGWEYFEIRSGSPPDGPPLLNYQGVVVDEGESLAIGVPNDLQYSQPTSGLTFYAELDVTVRGLPGLYLHQEWASGALPTAYPVCTLLWQDGDVIYSLAGICDSHPEGRYGLHLLLLGANRIPPTPTAHASDEP